MSPRESVRPGAALLALALSCAAPLVACAPASQNVRAFRAYAHEDTSLKVSLDRIEDMARTLELVDRILTQTTYTPGDVWIRRLPLGDPEFRALKEELRGRHPYNTGQFEVPILKVYREHVQRTLDEFRPPPEKPMYPSILDAVAGLVPRTPAIKAHWEAYREATAKLGEAIEAQKQLEDELAGRPEAEKQKRAADVAAKQKAVAAAQGEVAASKAQLAKDAALLESDAKLSDAQKKQIARDALSALSVAFRIELEALALAPIVTIQTVRALPGAPRELVFRPTLKMARQVWQLPTYIAGVQERFTRQIVVLEGMTKVLAQALQTSVEESPGFALRESVVDQIVGITLDSIRVDLKAGGEAFVFSSIQTAAQQSTSNEDGSRTESYDYTGRAYKLDYRVRPIFLATARLDVVLDWIRLPGVARLGFGYSTDRAWRSGGEIEQSSLSKQLGLKGTASDVFDIGLGILGIRSSAKIARFTSGEVRQVQANDVTNVVSTAPLQLTMTQIDVGYDVLFALGDASAKAFMEELVVGFRYFRYALPRILYQLRNTSTDPNHKTFVFDRESPIQQVESQYWLGGLTARFGVGEAPALSPFLDLALFGGAGPSSFYFLRDPLLGDVPQNREFSKQAAWVVNGGLGGGVRWRLLPRGFRARLDLRAYYRADFVYTQIDRSSGQGVGETRTDFGTVDVFHGPTIALRGAL